MFFSPYCRTMEKLNSNVRLPMLLGIITHSKPFCMVTQFHGVRDQSVTLHQAVKGSFLTPQDSADIFLEICSALKHIQSRGSLHNDIKANNVVLEKSPTASEKYSTVLIDFGKSTKVSASSVPLTSSRKRIAPEHNLKPEKLFSPRGNKGSAVQCCILSVSKMLGFYLRVRALSRKRQLKECL